MCARVCWYEILHLCQNSDNLMNIGQATANWYFFFTDFIGALYGYEICFLTLKFFQNKILRGITEPNKEYATEGWRHTISCKICTHHQLVLGWLKMVRWAAHGENAKSYKILVTKSEGNRPLGRYTEKDIVLLQFL